MIGRALYNFIVFFFKWFAIGMGYLLGLVFKAAVLLGTALVMYIVNLFKRAKQQRESKTLEQ